MQVIKILEQTGKGHLVICVFAVSKQSDIAATKVAIDVALDSWERPQQYQEVSIIIEASDLAAEALRHSINSSLHLRKKLRSILLVGSPTQITATVEKLQGYADERTGRYIPVVSAIERLPIIAE